jgi:hypothetical protein
LSPNARNVSDFFSKPYLVLGGNGIFLGGALSEGPFNGDFLSPVPAGFAPVPAPVPAFGLGLRAEPGLGLGLGVGICSSSSAPASAAGFAAGTLGGFNLRAGEEDVASLGFGVGTVAPGDTGFGLRLRTGGISVCVASSGGMGLEDAFNGFNGGASSVLGAEADGGGSTIFGVGDDPVKGFNGGASEDVGGNLGLGFGAAPERGFSLGAAPPMAGLGAGFPAGRGFPGETGFNVGTTSSSAALGDAGLVSVFFLGGGVYGNAFPTLNLCPQR